MSKYFMFYCQTPKCNIIYGLYINCCGPLLVHGPLVGNRCSKASIFKYLLYLSQGRINDVVYTMIISSLLMLRMIGYPKGDFNIYCRPSN